MLCMESDMGWSAWALDNLWLVAGGSLVVSFALHFVITWLFKNSGNTVNNTADKKVDKSDNQKDN